jgi:hypothetical protein
VKPVRFGDTTVTSARTGERKSGFFTFLLAVLVAAGLIALVGLQGLPWLQKPQAQASKEPAVADVGREAAAPPQAAPPSTAPKAEPKSEAKAEPKSEAREEPKSEAKAEQPTTVAPPPVTIPPPPSEPAKVERKPSPMAPAEPVRRAPPQVAATIQPVTVITSPSGATATLDGRTDAVCTTPCTLDALAGRHSIALKLAGYQMEQREFSVGSGPLELPIVVLRAPSGVLMLTSTPPGASVLVNGRQTGKTTPAQIPLPPGNYKITIERDGRQATQNVEMHGGISYLRISFEQ